VRRAARAAHETAVRIAPPQPRARSAVRPAGRAGPGSSTRTRVPPGTRGGRHRPAMTPARGGAGAGNGGSIGPPFTLEGARRALEAAAASPQYRRASWTRSHRANGRPATGMRSPPGAGPRGEAPASTPSVPGARSAPDAGGPSATSTSRPGRSAGRSPPPAGENLAGRMPVVVQAPAEIAATPGASRPQLLGRRRPASVMAGLEQVHRGGPGRRARRRRLGVPRQEEAPALEEPAGRSGVVHLPVIGRPRDAAASGQSIEASRRRIGRPASGRSAPRRDRLSALPRASSGHPGSTTRPTR
jgi:hypothetical protein